MLLLTLLACKDNRKPGEELLERKTPISATSEWINTKAAIRTLQNDIRRKPGDQKKKFMLALAYMQEARITGEHPHYYPLAQKLLDEVIGSRPDDRSLLFEALVAKATVQLSLHEFDKALRTGNAAFKLDTTTASLYGVFCDAYAELGNYPQAIASADKMTSIRPDIRSYSRISYLREIHGDVQGAIEAMQEAIQSGMPGLEQTAWARITLGGLYESTGRLAEAEMQYNIALAERPHYPFALGSLGRLEAKRKNYSKAIELLKRASGIIPEFSFLQNLASVYKLTGEKNKARYVTDELLQSLQEDQKAGHAVDLELANIHLELTGDIDEAYGYANKEYRRRPGNIDVCKTMAKIFYMKSNLKEAERFIENASRTNKQDAEIFCLKGMIAHRSGDEEKGWALINKGLAINPFLNESMMNEINQLKFLR